MRYHDMTKVARIYVRLALKFGRFGHELVPKTFGQTLVPIIRATGSSCEWKYWKRRTLRSTIHF